MCDKKLKVVQLKIIIKTKTKIKNYGKWTINMMKCAFII